MKPGGNKKNEGTQENQTKKKSTFNTLRDKKYSHERIDAVKKKGVLL